MERWDDAIAEEKNVQNQPLLNSLQHLYQTPVTSSPLTLEAQQHIAESVRTRLTSQDILFSGQTPKQRISQTPAKKPIVLRPLFHAPHRLRIVNVSVAILLAIALVGGAWFLFNHESSLTNRVFSPTNTIATGTPINSSSSLTTVRTQANGVEAVMQITPGPYFLSELLEANLSLTNHTKTTFNVQGVPETVPCNPALYVNTDITRGTKPHYDVSVLTGGGFMSCPLGITPLRPGQTIHLHDDIALTVSGKVTLTLTGRFAYGRDYDPNGKTPTPIFDPLAHHWPAIAISVASKIPSNRVISLQWHSSQVTINAPSEARTNLRYYFTCSQSEVANSGESGNFIWAPLTKTTLGASPCAGSLSKWTFAVGAPGYTIVNGHFPF
jgi:hypothetical protein